VQGVELIVASDETHIFDMHLKNMGNQKVVWNHMAIIQPHAFILK
jgi:hypothetical protein